MQTVISMMPILSIDMFSLNTADRHACRIRGSRGSILDYMHIYEQYSRRYCHPGNANICAYSTYTARVRTTGAIAIIKYACATYTYTSGSTMEYTTKDETTTFNERWGLRIISGASRDSRLRIIIHGTFRFIISSTPGRRQHIYSYIRATAASEGYLHRLLR